MAFKFIAAFVFVTVASAGYIQPQQQFYQAAPAEHTVAVAPSTHHVLTKNVEEYDPNPQYKYSYDVQDAITGDSKSQSETRNGDAVEGEYSLIDADGYKRIVHYTADAEHGFNAVVTRVPLNGAHHDNTQHEVKATPIAYSAPTVVKTVQPVEYTSPSYYKSAPVHYASAAPSAVLKTIAPASYASPSYYKSDSSSYAAPTILKAATPVSYSAPTYYKSAPVVHAAPASYVHDQQLYAAPQQYLKASSSLSSGYHH